MPEVANNPIHSYDLQVETKVNIDELIYMLNPNDLPLLSGIGADGGPIVPRIPVDNRVYYWLEEDMPLPRSYLNESDFDSTETDLTLPTGHGVWFAGGDVIRIDDEFISITSVNLSTDVATVVRGALGSTNVAHAINAEILGVGTVLQEGEIGDQNFSGRSKISNFTQIWTSKIEMTRTEQRIPKYGVPSELVHQTMGIMLSEGVNQEHAALYGLKYEDDTTQKRSTGGLWYFIDAASQIDSTSEWADFDSIEALQANAYDLGGGFEYFMARPHAFAALNNIAGNERIQTVTIDDARRGRARARVLITEFGEIQLVRNRWVRKTDGFLYSRAGFVVRQLQPAVVIKLAKTKDTDSYMYVCEFGFQVKGADHMAKFSALNPNADLPAVGL